MKERSIAIEQPKPLEEWELIGVTERGEKLLIDGDMLAVIGEGRQPEFYPIPQPDVKPRGVPKELREIYRRR